MHLVSERYSETLRRHLLRGRPLSREDVQDRRKVAVVNQSLSKRYFGSADPLGERIVLRTLGELPKGKVTNPSFEIIGVVADAKNQGLVDPLLPEVLVPSTVTDAFLRGILIRTEGAPLAAVEDARRAIWAVDRGLALGYAEDLSAFIARISYAEPRFGLVVLGIFASLGLILVALGIYSVVAYRVSRQTREIGIRMALGATGGTVLLSVMKHGLTLVAAGVAAGLLMSLAVTKILAQKIYGVAPHDAATLCAAIAVATVAALSACYFPARRATRVDPMIALRGE